MSFVNYITNEINCKIVYYGPGLGGKTSNIQYIYKKTNPDHKGKMINLNTENDRTLFFDFLPLELKPIRGYKTRFHLYTVPGQAFYEPSRRLILRGVDGIVFVADSQIDRMDANIESLKALKDDLAEHGYDINKKPLVMQWNKRDLDNIAPIEQMEEELNEKKLPSFEACALTGEGVMDTLKSVSKYVLMNVKGGLQERELR